MAQGDPTRFRSAKSPGLVIVAIVATLSLALNLLLLAGAWYVYQQVAPLRQAAADMGHALRQAGSEPFTLTFPISQSLPLHLDVPIQRTVEVRVDTTVPVDTSFRLELNLPVVGLITRDIPIQLDVPVHITAPVVLDTVVPISLSIPISLTVPVVLDMNQLPAGADLVHLGTVLEGWGP